MPNFVCYGCYDAHFINPLMLARHIVKYNDTAHLPYRAWALLTIKNGGIPAVGLYADYTAQNGTIRHSQTAQETVV